ncbi:putative lactoylglutathione lyase [Algoriphagus sp. 4150]|uniref:VOC family protein n=1 Tax=Algoriphagus sp. 4150 TaxID=2817756 RepID=UPI002856F224|nr:VOC family protein [Algoriphagus sp. 4150]MDR7130583.1 putative lactoylglutathione lyase [Algoriphagus sp. 4150]
MTPKQIWANLGVENIERTKEFYLALGFKLNGHPTKELVSFFFGADEFVIHFFEKEKLKTSLEGELSDLSQGNEIMFTLSAGSKGEFDQWIEEIENAGGTVFFDSNKDRKAYYDENGFHVCVFADPDGHKFNLLYSNSM